MPLVMMYFSAAVISQIVGSWEGAGLGDEGSRGTEGGPKQTFRNEHLCYAINR